LVDLDGDGRRDLISGSWPGELYFFRGLEGNRFAAAEVLKDAKGNPIKLGSASAVFAADWRGKGVLDLIVGNIEGDVYLVPNEGRKTKPAFGKAEKLRADGKEIKVAGDSGPCVADWDGDGRLDLLVGAGDGSVTLFRNTGKGLAAGQVLVPAMNRDAKAPCVGHRTKVCVVDYNGDGRPDLLVGDFHSEMAPPPEPKDPKEKEAHKRAEAAYQAALKEYQQAWTKLGIPELVDKLDKLDVPPAGEGDAAREKRLAEGKKVRAEIDRLRKKLLPAIEKMSKAREKSAQPTWRYHGWVWLYERKPAAR
jgi:hypothetical protein